MARQIEILVQGILGTHPHLIEAEGRRPYCHFRLASTPSFRVGKEWSEGETLWFTVKAWGALALNLARSLRRGDPVLVTGRFTQETWQRQSDGSIQTTNVLSASAAGHDLTRGTTHFMRTTLPPAAPAEEDRPGTAGAAVEDTGGPGAGDSGGAREDRNGQEGGSGQEGGPGGQVRGEAAERELAVPAAIDDDAWLTPLPSEPGASGDGLAPHEDGTGYEVVVEESQG